MPRRVLPLPLGESERASLRELSRARGTPRGVAERAAIVLAAADGQSHAAIARRLGCSVPTVTLWRRRFAERGIAGLRDAHRSGRPRRYDERFRQTLIATTLAKPEDGSTHWSTRRLAKEVGASASTVRRIWRKERLKPHRVESFKFSRDPKLVEKVIDVVGLYLHPPEGAIVLSVDEKTMIQALSRTQPMLPLRAGQVARRSHDYRRNGTTDLYAALEVHSGKVTTRSTQRHRAVEFLDFLRQIDRHYPRRRHPGAAIHIVLDNSSTHKAKEVQAWLAERRHRRFQLHFTPTSASWMNQVETWFGILTEQVIRRGDDESVRALVARIERFVREWSEGTTPFTWVKTADEILAKAIRKPQETSGAGH
ncbi:MAG: IS630 family transposase [Chloroflexota bacterium]